MAHMHELLPFRCQLYRQGQCTWVVLINSEVGGVAMRAQPLRVARLRGAQVCVRDLTGSPCARCRPPPCGGGRGLQCCTVQCMAAGVDMH